MLAGVASFFACLRSFPSTLWGRATKNPYQAALTVGIVALSALGYRAWRADALNKAFHKSLNDWVDEVSKGDERDIRNFAKSAIENCRESSEKNLLLSANGLTSLPLCVFQALPNLKNLNLFNNKLETIPDELGQLLPQLERLNLAYNRLKTLPESFANLQPPTSKCKLLLGGNQSTELPKISNHPNLEIDISVPLQLQWAYKEGASPGTLRLRGTYAEIQKKYAAYKQFAENLQGWCQEDENNKKIVRQILDALKESEWQNLHLQDISPDQFPRHLVEPLKDAGIKILNK